MIPPPSLAALLSSIISLIIILLLHPPSSSASVGPTLPLLLHHFLSISASLRNPRKRKPTSDPDSDSDEPHPALPPRLAQLLRVDSRLSTDPSSFRAHFNMSPSTFQWLSDLLEPLLDCRDPVGSPLNLSPEFRLGIGLFRLSTGADYPQISRVFKVSECAAIFCSNQLCRVLCTNFRFWVGFPNPAELKSVSNGFQSSTGLPNCCGVMGCLRFPIKRASRDDDQFIATQIVVDSNSKLLNIVAGFHGDQGNLDILKSTTLYKDVESGRLLNSPPLDVNGVSIPQYFVGQSGYPLLPWLMVPFSDPNSGSSEKDFDSAIGLMQAPLLKAAASLKSWGVLRKPIEGEMRNAVAYLGSCAILHNALLIREDFSAFCSEIDEEIHVDYILGCSNDAIVVQESNQIKARLTRSTLAEMAKNPCSGMSD